MVGNASVAKGLEEIDRRLRNLILTSLAMSSPGPGVALDQESANYLEHCRSLCQLKAETPRPPRRCEVSAENEDNTCQPSSGYLMVTWSRPPGVPGSIIPLRRPTTYQLWWEQSLVQGRLPGSKSINQILQLSQAKLAQQGGANTKAIDPEALGLGSHCMLIEDVDAEDIRVLVDGGSEGLAAGAEYSMAVRALVEPRAQHWSDWSSWSVVGRTSSSDMVPTGLCCVDSTADTLTLRWQRPYLMPDSNDDLPESAAKKCTVPGAYEYEVHIVELVHFGPLDLSAGVFAGGVSTVGQTLSDGANAAWEQLSTMLASIGRKYPVVEGEGYEWDVAKWDQELSSESGVGDESGAGMATGGTGDPIRNKTATEQVVATSNRSCAPADTERSTNKRPHYFRGTRRPISSLCSERNAVLGTADTVMTRERLSSTEDEVTFAAQHCSGSASAVCDDEIDFDSTGIGSAGDLAASAAVHHLGVPAAVRFTGRTKLKPDTNYRVAVRARRCTVNGVAASRTASAASGWGGWCAAVDVTTAAKGEASNSKATTSWFGSVSGAAIATEHRPSTAHATTPATLTQKPPGIDGWELLTETSPSAQIADECANSSSIPMPPVPQMPPPPPPPLECTNI
eukprot:SAG31_NODE_672_length_12933_cov_3.746143_4_plen_624_part_00